MLPERGPVGAGGVQLGNGMRPGRKLGPLFQPWPIQAISQGLCFKPSSYKKNLSHFSRLALIGGALF
ncbi:hypothetical protein NL676_038750 [Syzygium grande]|nr:hypothetical protein NL676_038750 [Syzygium grande]